MKPKQNITTFDSGSSMLKVSKRNSFLHIDNSSLFKHRTSSFRLKQSETKTIKYKGQDCSSRSSDIPKQDGIIASKTLASVKDELLIKTNSANSIECSRLINREEHCLTPKKKPNQSIGIPHLKRRRKTTSTKIAPLVSISPADYEGVIKKMEIPYVKKEESKLNPIKSYCAPDPFANFNQEELEKMIVNFKMPETKFQKDNFRKVYREHVIQTLQSICLIKSLKCPTDKEIEPKRLSLTMPPNSITVNRV